jgi:nuclear transport factor 2 (NTF2) superfamily protein
MFFSWFLRFCSSVLAGVFVTSCSINTYGPVPPSTKQKQEQKVIAAWENKNATVDCGKNGYAVFTDEQRGKNQTCKTPPRKSNDQKPVYDLKIVRKYPCNGAKEFLAFVENRDDLAFCYRYKRKSQEPDPNKYYVGK